MASNSTSAADDSIRDLLNLKRRHEVAVAELKNLPSYRAVYRKNGNIFFRTTVEKATALEQRQLDAAKATLESSNLP